MAAPHAGAPAPPACNVPPPRPSRSTELERLRSQGVEAPRDKADMFFGAAPLDETFSPGAGGRGGARACGQGGARRCTAMQWAPAWQGAVCARMQQLWSDASRPRPSHRPLPQ